MFINKNIQWLLYVFINYFCDEDQPFKEKFIPKSKFRHWISADFLVSFEKSKRLLQN